MICALGLCAISHAGKAMDAQCDLSERGGRLTISRRVSPSRQRSSSCAMTLMCQLRAKSVAGLSSRKLRSANVQKSLRSTARYCSGVSSDLDIFSPRSYGVTEKNTEVKPLRTRRFTKEINFD